MVDSSTFNDLVAEGSAVPVAGWDFSWFTGRAREQRPSWGYARMLGRRMASVTIAVDLQTGGGEVLATIPAPPPLLVATECWPPNRAVAARALRPLGGRVVAAADELLPFADNTFDLVVSRHPVTTPWLEIARILRPGGVYFSQQIGAGQQRELREALLGPQSAVPSDVRDPDRQADAARAAGLEVVDLRVEQLWSEFYDIAAVVYFLRKVVWTVPDFSVDAYREPLLRLYDRIRAEGRFRSRAPRFLIEARKTR